MKKDNYVVIMAGGIGSRFWPYSRNAKPKQFLDVLGMGLSLLQMTYERFLNVCPAENILVVTNESYKGLIEEQLPDILPEHILLEPIGRNTAPCIAYASYKIKNRNPNASIVVTPADHAVFKENEFTKVIKMGLKEVSKTDKLITIGIEPNRPETGYGYIQYHTADDGEIKRVKTFTEKPQLDLAKKFLECGDFVWNAGIFIWSAKTIVNAFEKHLPEMAEMFAEGNPAYYTKDEANFIANTYVQCKQISIDYGIMEKAAGVHVLLGDFGWSDLGAWDALHEIRDKDKNNNAIDGNVMLYDVKNCLFKGPQDKLIVAQGLDGYLVTECGNVILICKKDDEINFKRFLRDARDQKGDEFT